MSAPRKQTTTAPRKKPAKAKVEGRGAVARGRGAVAAGERGVAAGRDIGVAISGRFEGSLYVGAPTDDPKKALRLYQEMLVATCRDVPLRALDTAAADATGRHKGMDLAAIYVDLDTTAHVEVSAEPKKGRTRDVRQFFAAPEQRPLRALEAVAQHRKLVLLGDPGSGKSTFVNFITRCLSSAVVEPKGRWLERLPGWPRAAKGLLPVVVILRDFALALAGAPQAGEATPQQLWSFVVAGLDKQNLGFAAKHILAEIEAGRALVLLDGLDEVPTNAQRSLVRDAVGAFMGRHGKSDYLVTCRTLSYQDAAWQLPDVKAFTLAPFDDEKIDRFIHAWYEALGRSNVVTRDEAGTLSAALAEAVKRRDLAPLAASPLLLTTMAVLHTKRARLPDARALLYEETVDLLLWHHEAPKKTKSVRALLDEADRSEMDLKLVLAKIAFDAHGAASSEDGEGLAGIPELVLLKALAAIHPKPPGLDWADSMVKAIKLRAGLLVERAPGLYTLPHRTFQEYLAGMHLMQEKFAESALAKASEGPQWREAILLAVGRLVHKAEDKGRPLELVGELCGHDEVDTEVDWRNAWLAGEVLLEVGLHRITSTLGRDLAKRVQGRLADLVQRGRLGAVERAKAGDVLAKLGDPRFDENMWGLPRDGMLGFVKVPGGKFWMGSDKAQDARAYDDELPQHEMELPEYWMGKYPVTVAQFRAFVRDSGMRPQYPQWAEGVANHPVVGVTWEEAMSYAAWLTEKLRESPSTPEPLARLLGGADNDGRQWRVTLPSEVEWEKAARGRDGRIYPWGDAPDPTRANYGDTGIGTTSAVGCFRAGASPHGCEDMSGNVWEWTRNRLLGYPLEAGSDSNDVADGAQNMRAVRGGAFCDGDGGVRCAYRLDYDVTYWNLGFRVAVSPFL